MEVKDTKEQKRFTMRIDNNLFDLIKIRAAKNKRSAVKEIEFILEKEIKQAN